MKKNLFFSLSAMLLLSACSNDMKDAVDNVPMNQPTLQYMEFTASAGADTRTQLTADNKVEWVARDEISIFDGTANRKFTTKNSGPTAVFTGQAAKASTYYALYPYQQEVTIEGNVLKNVALPSIQTAKAGSFDAEFNLSVASSSAESMQFAFKNVGALVKFSVSNDKASEVKSIKLTSHDASAVLAGTADITISDQPTAVVKSGQQSVITLNAPNGLEAGKHYYFSVLPGTLSKGFTLTFVNSEGKTWQKSRNASITAERSGIISMKAVEIGTFTKTSLTNKNLIAAAEASTGKAFTKDEDGSVSLLNDDNYQIVMAVTNLDVSSKEDPTICEEIGFFSNLEVLNCSYNDITSLDLSKNTALTWLECVWNPLTSLDLSNNIKLTRLNCYLNKLTSIDLSKNTALTELICASNKLSNLDLSNNTALTKLDCFGNPLWSLDVSKNTALTYLNCGENQLRSLDLSKNTKLTWLGCYQNYFSNLDLSKQTELTVLVCYLDQLTSLDLSNNTALTELICRDNQLTSLDLSKNVELTRLWCGSNQLTSLDLSNNTALTALQCRENQLTSLDLTKNVALTGLYCYGNQLTSLDLSKNTELINLSCYDNQLTNLDISDNNQIDWRELYVGSQTDSSYNGQELTLYVNANHIMQELPDPDGKNKNVNKLLLPDTDAAGTHEDYSETDY